MRGIALLLCSCLALAADPWIPGDHPAPLLRPVSGLTRPAHVIAVAFEAAGRLADPGPELGGTVAADAAVRLDDALARADLAIAEAALAQARAESGFRTRESERLERLFADGRLSAGERDAAMHAALAAALACAHADAALARQRRILDHHHVRLPTGWKVLARHREAGSVIQPGEAVLELGDPSSVVVRLHLTDEEIAALPSAVATVGGAVHAIDAVRISDRADEQSRKRLVEIVLPGAAGGGREALVTLRLPDPAGALAIPETHLRAALDGRFVRTADGGELRVTILRALGDGTVAVLPVPGLAAARLVVPAP